MTSLPIKRASLLISLILVAALAPTHAALAANDHANDHANDKAKCLSANDTRPWDCLDTPGIEVAPPAQDTNDGDDPIGLDFVQEGTTLVFKDLDNLKNQQDLTKDALQALTSVQDLHNKVIPETAENQGDLSSALSATSNLNDTQKEELRKTLFIFEEFYKSASALLAKLTELTEKLAANISR